MPLGEKLELQYAPFPTSDTVTVKNAHTSTMAVQTSKNVIFNMFLAQICIRIHSVTIMRDMFHVFLLKF